MQRRKQKNHGGLTSKEAEGFGMAPQRYKASKSSKIIAERKHVLGRKWKTGGGRGGTCLRRRLMFRAASTNAQDEERGQELVQQRSATRWRPLGRRSVLLPQHYLEAAWRPSRVGSEPRARAERQGGA
jgi:hypothetical protein